MTWGGGKPHAVGDRGQRYTITYADQNGVRQVFGWCDKLEGAMSMAHSVMLHLEPGPSARPFKGSGRGARMSAAYRPSSLVHYFRVQHLPKARWSVLYIVADEVAAAEAKVRETYPDSKVIYMDAAAHAAWGRGNARKSHPWRRSFTGRP